MKLRYYQAEAINALFDYWEHEAGNPLIDLATGAGKSLVMSEIIIQLLEGWPDLRIGVITHVKELIEQNYDELKGMWPMAPAGIVSSGLSRYDYSAQILFGGIQTIWNKSEYICDLELFASSSATRHKPFDIILIDECFVAGTMIETEFGPKPIERVKIGDRVRNAFGFGLVEATSEKWSETIELELSNGKRIECTKNHPFFTSNGWTKAGELEEGTILFGPQEVRKLRGGIWPYIENGKGGEGTHLGEDSFLLNILLKEKRECNEYSGREGKDDENSKQNWSQADFENGERVRNDKSAKESSFLARNWLGFGVSNSNWNEEGGRSNFLSSGHSESRDEGGNRVGRTVSLRKETGFGQEERCISSEVRVVSISSKERLGRTPVYNLQVSGHPSYYAEGVLVHNCHLIPPDDGKMYTNFFEACRKVNPEVKFVGLTATPYRLGTGRLDSGEGRLFDRVIYTYSIADGVRDGYLTPLTTKGTSVEISAKGVRKDGKGEFNKKQAEKAADEITREAIAEIVRRGSDRRSWMLFCSGKDHALTCRDELRSHGITCEAVTDETPKGERRDILAAYKAYEIQALTNNAVLTTGFNHKGVDLIAFLRLTMSVSLYLQMAGRGTRPLYADGFNEHDPRWTAEDRRAAIANGPKPNCLVLDFARLVDTHGPVDSVSVDEKTRGDGEAPSKMCPTDREDKGIDAWEEGRTEDIHAPRDPIFGCGEKLHAAARFCKECGFRFEFETGPKIDAVADDKPIMAAAEAEWREVKRRAFKLNQGKNGKRDTVMVLYYCETGKSITEWLCVEHKGWMAQKASAFWTSHGGSLPVPLDCIEWIARQNELGHTKKIQVKPGKKGYWDVMRAVPLNPAPEDKNAALFVKSTGKRKTRGRSIIDDDIPY